MNTELIYETMRHLHAAFNVEFQVDLQSELPSRFEDLRPEQLELFNRFAQATIAVAGTRWQLQDKVETLASHMFSLLNFGVEWEYPPVNASITDIRLITLLHDHHAELQGLYRRVASQVLNRIGEKVKQVEKKTDATEAVIGGLGVKGLKDFVENLNNEDK